MNIIVVNKEAKVIEKKYYTDEFFLYQLYKT